ncbi:ankyrin repeat domain-containing protein [Nocardia huaxiensis]|uniref:Ankyrin repeat domain-containing protein n=1 Tax=Nocardia huaxiensis TaxID=2755382 RepID=A0A7D6V8I4_9NOCA|nr:ankyrin repeat domain-containing protein [Nocardia huaxiensis]QLY28242.1 ankyrin repeat domain-containing protein [Nocardia huaxiensis]UFS98323.1 ankyrin repeat domain-containing protein [Nocardia huaxiensis]
MSAEDIDPQVLELASKIFDMARSGDAAGLASYIEAGVPVNLTNDRGDTLLMLAAYYGHADAVTTLLAHGADPNGATGSGQTPVAGAVFHGAADVVKALLAAGADLDAGAPSARESAAMFDKTEWLEAIEKS